MHANQNISDHPLDIFQFMQDALAAGRRCVLAALIEVNGPSAREIGSMMAIREDGQYAGLMSNGCVDGDIAIQALETLKDGKARRVIYGAGSPYLDIKLPCGGSLEVLLLPDPERNEISKAIDLWQRRRPVDIFLNSSKEQHFTIDKASASPARARESEYHFLITPPLHIIVAGQGPETQLLTQLARVSNFKVTTLTPSEHILETCADIGAHMIKLNAANSAPHLTGAADGAGDPWTAIITLFHDHDWELNLLEHALTTKAFYIGAMGSRKTQQERLARLKERGASEADLGHIKGPIGLIHSARSPATLAISVLAEIVDTYRNIQCRPSH